MGEFYSILVIVVSVFLSIAPLMIWRNTNTTNRLLTLLLIERGYDKETIEKNYASSSSYVDYDDIKVSSSAVDKTFHID